MKVFSVASILFLTIVASGALAEDCGTYWCYQLYTDPQGVIHHGEVDINACSAAEALARGRDLHAYHCNFMGRANTCSREYVFSGANIYRCTYWETEGETVHANSPSEAILKTRNCFNHIGGMVAQVCQ